jgi:hypothetical protein
MYVSFCTDTAWAESCFVLGNINFVLCFGLQVLTICNRIMDDVIPTERANRDFRAKFPDDVMQENLAGQLWFGAEVSCRAHWL